MKPQELRASVQAILAGGGTHINLIRTLGKMPAGFPRGELQTVSPNTGEHVCSYDAAKLLAWLDKYMPEKPNEDQS